MTAEDSTPAVSQVGVVPGGGASSKRQRRQGVARLPPASCSQGASPPAVWGRDRECRADRSHCTAIDIGNAAIYSVVVGEVARFEVVQTVHENVDAGRVAGDVAVVEVVDDGRHVDGRVDPGETLPGSFRLGDGVFDILFVEQDLPLEIGHLDNVPVDNDQIANAGASEEFGGHAAERAAPQYECRRFTQPSLPFLTETRKQRLAMVTGQVVTHVLSDRAQSSAQLNGNTASPGIQRQDLPSVTGSVNSHGSVTTSS